MPTMPDNYYDRFNEAKNYEKILIREGYGTQGSEINELQSSASHRLKGIADALFKDGDIIRDASVIIDKDTGKVRAASGAVYLKGAVRGVADAEFTIPITGTIAIGVRLIEKVVSELEDKSLYNPAIGSRGEGEPGAWRLQVTAQWGFDPGEPDAGGEFYPVYTVDDGELRPKEAPPTLDSFTQGIAKYDRDSTAGGSYIVSGLTVRAAENAASGEQVYTITEGRARVNGYGVELPTSRRLTYAAVPDLRTIDTEVHTADASSSQSGGQRLIVAHPPIHAVNTVRITTRKNVNLTHGAYSGASDALPDTAVVSIIECRQGNTVFAQGSDYKKTGDKVDWSPSGAEPATGSTYSVTYDCITTAPPLKPDADGFSVEGAVLNSSILITYQQALPRLDRLALTQEGQFQWLQGVASETNPRGPAVSPSLLPIATVFQAWREPREVRNDGVRVVPFSEIEAINNRIDYVLNEVARQRLEADVFTRESGARVGLFVDPLLGDDMRDQGLDQSAAVIPAAGGGVLTLPVTAQALGLSADVTVPTGAVFTPKVLLEQPFRTGAMNVNPYSAFEPLPARVSLTPAVDRWTETQTKWTSSITEKFDVTRDGYFHIVVGQESSSRTEQVGSTTKKIEHLRQIDVAFRIEGFGIGEKLAALTFDGISLPASGTADGSGVLSGVFRIPANIPAGAKTVSFTGSGGTRGSAVFVGQGELTVETLRQVNTITTTWVDPLAQTFVTGRNTQLCGCELWFTAAGSDVRVQIREVQNGVPGRAILTEAVVAQASLLTNGQPTRVLFPAPLRVAGDNEYALVVLCDDAITALAVAELGKFDALRQTWITSQPYQVGVLLSSSNASTWTAHQDRDMTFRLLEASFAPSSRQLDLGTTNVNGATEVIVLALEENPTANTRVEYDLTLPGGEKHTVAAGQPVRLSQAVSGTVAVSAKLAGDDAATPLLWPGTQLVSGTAKLNADYYSRSIPAGGATKAVLIYDAVIPSGATVLPEIQINNGAWQKPAADGSTQQGDGLVEYRFKTALTNADNLKARFTLTGTVTARPMVRNIRLVAVI